ncbi:MAG: agmatinase [Acidobacteriota bacterium]
MSISSRARRGPDPFLGVDPPADPSTARSVIVPVPFERTVSYGRGTNRGPAAVLTASQQVELWDEELEREPADHGVLTTPAIEPGAFDLSAALDEIENRLHDEMSDERFVVAVGGEHSLSIAAIRAAHARFGDIGVVQFDAHADLRASYEGTELSHACVMRRVIDDLGLATAAVGIRSLSGPEAELIRDRDLGVLWARDLDDRPLERFTELLDALPRRVFLTFDVDYFDPALLPATGTPEPGGGRWWPTLRLLRHLFAVKEVVAMDVVELAPIPGQPASDFITARLIYKCLGWRWP